MSVDAANKAEPISLPATCNGERSSENETVRQGMPEEQPRKNESKITDGEIRSSWYDSAQSSPKDISASHGSVSIEL